MTQHVETGQHSQKAPTGAEARERLVAAMPVAERRITAAGIDTAVLEGGEGPPLVLLRSRGS